MTTTDKNLQIRVSALDSLLADPRPDDSSWFEQVLSAFEQVTEYALDAGIHVKALSRTSQMEECVG